MNWGIPRLPEREVANLFRLTGLAWFLQRECPRPQHNYRRTDKSCLSPGEVKSGSLTWRESWRQTGEGMRVQLFHDNFRAHREFYHSVITQGIAKECHQHAYRTATCPVYTVLLSLKIQPQKCFGEIAFLNSLGSFHTLEIQTAAVKQIYSCIYTWGEKKGRGKQNLQ